VARERSRLRGTTCASHQHRFFALDIRSDVFKSLHRACASLTFLHVPFELRVVPTLTRTEPSDAHPDKTSLLYAPSSFHEHVVSIAGSTAVIWHRDVRQVCQVT
jgi:hypothetical protein